MWCHEFMHYWLLTLKVSIECEDLELATCEFCACNDCDLLRLTQCPAFCYGGISLKGLFELSTQYKKIKDKFCSPNGTMLIHFYL